MVNFSGRSHLCRHSGCNRKDSHRNEKRRTCPDEKRPPKSPQVKGLEGSSTIGTSAIRLDDVLKPPQTSPPPVSNTEVKGEKKFPLSPDGFFTPPSTSRSLLPFGKRGIPAGMPAYMVSELQPPKESFRKNSDSQQEN